jgi:hypothetical protein
MVKTNGQKTFGGKLHHLYMRINQSQPAFSPHFGFWIPNGHRSSICHRNDFRRTQRQLLAS